MLLYNVCFHELQHTHHYTVPEEIEKQVIESIKQKS